MGCVPGPKREILYCMLAGRPTRQPMVVETTAVKRGGWVDGVGDEVLLGGCILSVSVALLAACLLPTRRRLADGSYIIIALTVHAWIRSRTASRVLLQSEKRAP